MSIMQLLVDFPNYSARKIRRLAKQIAMVEEAEKHVTEPGVAKGIVSDLLEFNLQQARTEARMNDDTPEVVEASQTDRWFRSSELPDNLSDALEWIKEMRQDWVQVAKYMGFESYTDVENIMLQAERMGPAVKDMERTFVTPVSEAIRAIEELEPNITPERMARAKGIVRGSGFYTDQKIVRE